VIETRQETDGVGDPARPRVVAYFTIGTPYEEEAAKLKASLEEWGYAYTIAGIHHRGSWQENTQAKAPFCLQMLEEYEGEPLLYLDVDALMMRPPVLLDGGLDADLAAVRFIHRDELLSGTIWWGNTVQCRRVVRKWIYLNKAHPRRLPGGKAAWDQRTLDMAIQKVGGLRFCSLPQEYTYIQDLTPRHLDPCPPPVILHTRGSQRFKKQIDRRRAR